MKRILKGLLGLILVAVIGLGIWGYAPDRDAKELEAAYTTATSQFITLDNGLRVHVRDEGLRDGPALVLIHGSNSSLHTWEPWVARLKGQFRIVSLDLQGHGLTGAHPKRDYSAESFVATVDGVATKLGLTRFVLAGNSMGGWVSWNYALAHPGKLAGLVLVDASGAPDAKPKSVPIGFRLAQSPLVRPIMTVFTPRSVIEKSLMDTMSNDAIVTPAMVDRYWNLLRYPGNRQATGDRGGVRNRKLASPETMAQLKMPVLVMWGAEDQLIPLSAGQWFAKHIPGAQTAFYAKIGHIPMEETPDQSATDMARFATAAFAAAPVIAPRPGT
jgi:pimeloyl-ACP methyl ester carboxylesterase